MKIEYCYVIHSFVSAEDAYMQSGAAGMALQSHSVSPPSFKFSRWPGGLGMEPRSTHMSMSSSERTNVYTSPSARFQALRAWFADRYL